MGVTEYLADQLIRLADALGGAFPYLFLAAIAWVPALRTVRWFKRRAALHQFAQRHQLRFTSVLPSDKRDPFVYFAHVRSAVLLYLVMEGPWDGFEMAVADSPQGRRPTWTEVIVQLPADVPPFRLHRGEGRASHAGFGGRLDGATRVTPANAFLAANSVMTSSAPEAAAAALGPRTSELLLAGPPVVTETHFSYLRVSPMRQLPPDELHAFLGFAASLARALMADAQYTRR